MAIRTDVSINWEVNPRIITIDAPSTNITAQDLLDTLRSLEAEPTAMDDAPIVDASGKESLGGGVYVGLTVILQDSLLAFEDRVGPDYVQCNVSGGNLVAIEGDGITFFDTPIHPTAYTQVVVTASSSATQVELESEVLQDITDAVLDELVNNHLGDGTVGKALYDASLSEMDETELHTFLDSYSNKDAFKADLAPILTDTTSIESKVDNIQTDVSLMSTDISFIRDIEGGRWHIVGNQMVFYAEDNTTEVARFNLLDENGILTETDVFQRVKQ